MMVEEFSDQLSDQKAVGVVLDLLASIDRRGGSFTLFLGFLCFLDGWPEFCTDAFQSRFLFQVIYNYIFKSF